MLRAEIQILTALVSQPGSGYGYSQVGLATIARGVLGGDAGAPQRMECSLPPLTVDGKSFASENARGLRPPGAPHQRPSAHKFQKTSGKSMKINGWRPEAHSGVP